MNSKSNLKDQLSHRSWQTNALRDICHRGGRVQSPPPPPPLDSIFIEYQSKSKPDICAVVFILVSELSSLSLWQFELTDSIVLSFWPMCQPMIFKFISSDTQARRRRRRKKKTVWAKSIAEARQVSHKPKRKRCFVRFCESWAAGYLGLVWLRVTAHQRWDDVPKCQTSLNMRQIKCIMHALMPLCVLWLIQFQKKILH